MTEAEIKELRDKIEVEKNSLSPEVTYTYFVECCEKLLDELARLKSGALTEEEFHNLCHNFSEDDAERFRAGCLAYQEKLFGKQKGTR